MNIEKMREQRKIPHVALQTYNLIRSKHPNVVVCVFEGRDDVVFYETLFQRIGTTEKYTSFTANGKDPLLGLRALLSDSKEHAGKKTIYFVDKDYDGIKSYPHGEDIYITDTYSIENNLVSADVLEKILRSDLKCGHIEDDAIDHITTEYQALISQYKDKLKAPNLIIYHCRKSGTVLPSIDDAKDFFSVTHDSIKLKFDDPFEILGWPDHGSRDAIVHSEAEFDSLCPLKDWRGKFLFHFFQEFIKNQVERRTSRPQRVFKSRAPVTFNPKTELRTFAVFCEIPEELVRFTRHHLVRSESGSASAVSKECQGMAGELF